MAEATTTKKDVVNKVDPIDDSIDPENEIVGTRLLLIHFGVTLSSFLAGLVREFFRCEHGMETSR